MGCRRARGCGIPTSTAGRARRLEILRTIGLPDCVFTRAAAGETLTCGLAAFIKARAALLTSGEPYSGRGIKFLLFVRTGAAWRISAFAWEDERPGLEITVQPRRYPSSRPRCGSRTVPTTHR